MRRAMAMLSGLTMLLAASPGEATTWHVTENPESPEGVIGAVIEQAASGDTVMIGPGLYYEHISLGEKSITLIGADASSTVLDGSRDPGGSQGSILWTGWLSHGNVTFRGIRFQGGQGFLENGHLLGGGLLLRHCTTATITDCIFEDNHLDPSTSGYGGGLVFESGLGTLTMERCSFANNSARLEGGHLEVIGAAAATIRNCEFQVDPSDAYLGAGMLTGGCQTVVVEDCLFRSDVPPGGGMFGVYLGGINVSARRNRFEDAGGGTIASSVGMDFYGFPGEPSGTYVMEDNVFWNNGRAPSSPIVQIAGAYPSTSILRRNTFYRAPLWVSANDNLIERNIIYRSGEHSFVCCGHTRVVCNDQYPDTVRVGGHAPSFADNISADPLFCGPDTGDLTISMYSPCAPEHAPAGCGGIGALGTSCGVTPIETTTWGRLKLRFSK